ncbi:LPXTG-motif cell wall anchor domain-containing protein [Mucilaginibacter gossypiicola]|uniref:LPXTG-motif cell wall anchor domain-containing protein n=1 Tax=Mucilaginibacter gossypiicola TaxID=551995 RepID=A0A1H8V006_9SPHI|nr:LPXTG cell wall anchor domain-containing protein [Mucilaginibacter gossypiicola]SEP08567.1 LPXTG-motif cell wall anchor domain-containing protein [Mucilaginibacter gossypiicola]
MKAALYFSIFTTLCLSLLISLAIASLFANVASNTGDSLTAIMSLIPLLVISILFWIGFKRKTKKLLIVNIIYFVTPPLLMFIIPSYYSVDFILLHFCIALIYLAIIIGNYSKKLS